MASSSCQYECVVLGATGYTGTYTCEHITTHLPTKFKWAVAGRSESRLHQVVEGLKTISPDRTTPDVLVCSLNKPDLLDLVAKAKVLITTIGPYHLYGTPVVEACAESGTHYLDVTGEIPWTYDMVQRYHETAKKTGAIMISQDGVESAPSDLLCWLLATHIRETLNVGTKEVILTTWEMNSRPSGGTLATVLSLFETYTPSQVQRASNPWSLSPIPKPSTIPSPSSLTERVTGVRSDPDLGSLTFSIQAGSDLPIVHRSWALYDSGKVYGESFHASAYMKSSNALSAIITNLLFKIGLAALLLSPVRWLARKLIYAPGQGLTREEAAKESVEWRAIAEADIQDPDAQKKAMARMKWTGSMYHLTGVCLAESALLLARAKTFAHEIGGGMVTPATLGGQYVEALQTAGLEVDVRMMP